MEICNGTALLFLPGVVVASLEFLNPNGLLIPDRLGNLVCLSASAHDGLKIKGKLCSNRHKETEGKRHNPF